jgi:hypothetical protein
MVDVLREESWSVAYVLQTERFEAIIELRAPKVWVATLKVWSDPPPTGRLSTSTWKLASPALCREAIARELARHGIGS